MGSIPTERSYSFLVERLFALLLQGRRQHGDQGQRRKRQHGRTDRPRDEHQGAALRQQQCPAQKLFHHRPENETEQHRRRLGIDLAEDVAE
jgi:hypothetical protein